MENKPCAKPMLLLFLSATASASVMRPVESFTCSVKAAGFPPSGVKQISIAIDGHPIATIEISSEPKFDDPKAHTGPCFAIIGKISPPGMEGDSNLTIWTPEKYGQTHECDFYIQQEPTDSAPPKPARRAALRDSINLPPGADDDKTCPQNATPQIVPDSIIISSCLFCIRFLWYGRATGFEF